MHDPSEDRVDALLTGRPIVEIVGLAHRGLPGAEVLDTNLGGAGAGFRTLHISFMCRVPNAQEVEREYATNLLDKNVPLFQLTDSGRKWTSGVLLFVAWFPGRGQLKYMFSHGSDNSDPVAHWETVRAFELEDGHMTRFDIRKAGDDTLLDTLMGREYEGFGGWGVIKGELELRLGGRPDSHLDWRTLATSNDEMVGDLLIAGDPLVPIYMRDGWDATWLGMPGVEPGPPPPPAGHPMSDEFWTNVAAEALVGILSREGKLDTRGGGYYDIVYADVMGLKKRIEKEGWGS